MYVCVYKLHILYPVICYPLYTNQCCDIEKLRGFAILKIHMNIFVIESSVFYSNLISEKM